MTTEDTSVINKIFKKVDFNDEDFSFYILYPFIITHYPDANIMELDLSEKADNFKDALVDVLDLIRSNCLKIS